MLQVSPHPAPGTEGQKYVDTRGVHVEGCRFDSKTGVTTEVPLSEALDPRAADANETDVVPSVN